MRIQQAYIQRRKQHGLTLIELLVAALIGIIVIGGVGGVFLSVIQTNRAKMALDNSTEALRYAHYILANQIRNAEGIDVAGGHLVLDLQPGVPDCLGGSSGISRFSFANGSLRCATTGTPQEMVGGLQNVQFQFGCLVTGTPPAPAASEIRNADIVAARTACAVGNPFDDTVTTVFVTLTVDPFPGEGDPRSVEFAATARGIMAPRITRVLQIQKDPDLILELFAATATGTLLGKENTGCEHFGAIQASQQEQVFYFIRATDSNGIVQPHVTGGIALAYENVTASSEHYAPLDFAPINQVFSIALIDDHIKQGSRTFKVRLNDDEAFGTFEHVTIITNPVTTTICEGPDEPDQGIGPDDTVTLKLYASDADGNPLSPSTQHIGLEGQRLWFVVKAFAPNGDEIPTANGNIQVAITAHSADASLPVNPVPIGRAFAVDLLADAAPEGNESFLVSIQGGAVSGPIVTEQFEHVVPSTLPEEHTVQVTIVDMPDETARFAAAGSASSGATEIDVPWPSHVAGDLAVLIVETSGHQTIVTPPAGWTETMTPKADLANTAGSRLHVYHQFALNSSMPAANIRLPGGDHIVGRIFTFKGIDPDNPMASPAVVATKTTPSTTVTNPSADVTHPNTPVLLVATRPNDTADVDQFGVPTNPNLSNIEEAGEAGTDTGNGGGFRLAVGIKPTPGPTGPTTGTGPNTTNVTATILLKPR